MKIALLGGTGFVGEYLAESLKKRKDCKILIAGRGTSLDDTDYRDVDVLVILIQPNAKVFAEVSSFIAYSGKLKKVLYLSTFLLYPSSVNKSNEETAPDPKTLYERGKFQEELLLSNAIDREACKLCIARLGNIYGDIKNKGIINRILLSGVGKNKDLIIYGDCSLKKRDFIFIEDAVGLLEFLIFYNQKNKKEIFNICTGSDVSIGEIIRHVELILGKKVSFKKGEPVLGEKTVKCDNSKILKLSGYKFKYDLITGLKKSCRNYMRSYLV